ncbi:hypothetical protein PORCRE_419 [Porphyromonas crevioricanis JCM 15906]|uniref:Uncharacterized protein n=1 Tax=Porphyromonas crevioricanis JCM 15906 TaxID=1305617 RepID=S4N6T9_9PORP|nr:hypothetical protein PORCRE_419 [Porphyromonas crevioricanis JCM 15906]GAD08058.1 hypothetical protein PORCAN_1692 [Porphyromonas crevioricanis JCM 13913]
MYTLKRVYLKIAKIDCHTTQKEISGERAKFLSSENFRSLLC